MSYLVDELHAVAAKIAPYVDFVQVAEKATGIGGPPADVALTIIRAGVEALARVASGELTADQVRTEMRQLLSLVAATDAADDARADAIVAARRRDPPAP